MDRGRIQSCSRSTVDLNRQGQSDSPIQMTTHEAAEDHQKTLNILSSTPGPASSVEERWLHKKFRHQTMVRISLSPYAKSF